MVLLTIRIITVAVLLFGVIYGLIVNKIQKLPTFFRCALFSVICAFMAYLYYLALSTYPDLDKAFTAGIFGEAAQMLFIITANTRFMKDGSFNKKFSILAFLLAFILIIPQIFYVVFSFSLSNLACSIIYIATLGPCGYLCIANMLDNNKYQFRKATYFYNLLGYLMALFSTISQTGLALAMVFNSRTILIFGFGIPCMISCICESLSLVVLRKGLKAWNE